jgi:hypothetical protein
MRTLTLGVYVSLIKDVTFKICLLREISFQGFSVDGCMHDRRLIVGDRIYRRQKQLTPLIV